MVFRWHVAAAAETLRNKEIYDMLLDFKGALSAIALYVSATNGGSYNKDNELYKCIRKIEVKDGTAVKHSVTGAQEQALNAFNRRETPSESNRETPSYGQAQVFYADFAPQFADPNWWLDLRKYKNPTLYVDWNLEEVRSAGADAFLTNTGAITIALLLDEEPEKLSYRGYLRAEETRAWTTAASGEEPVRLPTDWPIRRILVRAYAQNKDPTARITKLKMDCDKGKFIPWEIDTPYLAKWVNDALVYKPEWAKYLYRKHGESYELPLSRIHDIQTQSWGATPRIISSDVFWNGYPALNLVDHAGAPVAAEENQVVRARGELFQHTMMLPFGQPLLVEPFFPAGLYSEIILKCTQGASGAAASVVTEQAATE